MKLRWWLIPTLCAVMTLTAYAQPVIFKDSRGRAIDTATWRDKWIIINYWAGWCDACVREVSQLNAFYQHHYKGVKLIGVNYDGLTGPDLTASINSMHIGFTVLEKDPAKFLRLPALDVLPTTFIINPQGKLVKTLGGPQTAAELREITHVHH